MQLLLTRESYKDDATMGSLVTPFGEIFTCERPWRDNANGVSCIPEGSYQCEKRWSNHFKRFVYGVKDVEGRSNILIHNGSYPEHSLGCILIGLTHFTANGKRGIGLSKLALEKFNSNMAFQPFTLIIRRLP